ncbi:MAG TPA: FKBP-type peptidyl-prolyl cis-trans isomerase [Gemmatimonadales bacterium]|nr:FKBP-type peptidyl-prolyl cis-trans isomerase [Gemmatimonadales bacterium]
MRRPALLVVGVVLAFAGCSPDSFRSPRARQGGPGQAEFADQLGVDLATMTRTPSGLYLRDVRAGSGTEAGAGRAVVVHYTGWLPDGRKFDSSRDAGRPFEFTLGAGQVIRGWDEGVAGMRVGGRRQLVIPPELGYGAAGVGPIPPHSTLVFEVELLEVR